MSRTHATRERILSATACIYAQHGMADTSLRAIVDLADVNLAAINYHFRSKNALIREMLIRELSPVANQRFELLEIAKKTFGLNLRPGHVISCIILPTLLQLRNTDNAESNSAVHFRAAADDTPFVRASIQTAFQPIVDAFIDAFCRASSEGSRSLMEWRAKLFCGTFAGSVCNRSISAMCAEILEEPHITIWRIVVEFACMAETMLSANTDRANTEQIVSDILALLGTHDVVIGLRRYLPLRFELPHALTASFPWPVRATVHEADCET
jgi:AcrR family transcriptional regulator